MLIALLYVLFLFVCNMNVLINYADAKYNPARRCNTWTGLHIAKFDRVFEFSPDDIDIEFKKTHYKILKEKRGNGLWLWKPYFVNKVINKVNDGDVIFYCDSGAFFIRDPKHILESLSDESPMFVCDIPLIESCWTKPFCFEKMGLNNEEIKESNQIIGTYFAVFVNDFTRKFMKEWLYWCCDYEMISPLGVKKGERPIESFGSSFVAHREDQSIFSLMCKKYSISAHKDFSQRGNDPESYFSPLYIYKVPIHSNDKYKSILFLHKAPKITIKVFLYYYILRLRSILRHILF